MEIVYRKISISLSSSPHGEVFGRWLVAQVRRRLPKPEQYYYCSNSEFVRMVIDDTIRSEGYPSSDIREEGAGWVYTTCSGRTITFDGDGISIDFGRGSIRFFEEIKNFIKTFEMCSWPEHRDEVVALLSEVS